MNQGEFRQGPQRRAGEGPAVFLSPPHPTWDFFLDERLSTSVRISSPGLSAGDKSSCLPEAPSKAGGANKRLCVTGTELACLEVGHPHRHPSGQPGEDSLLQPSATAASVATIPTCWGNEGTRTLGPPRRTCS